MCKASKYQVCPSNAKYRVIKFNLKYVPPPRPKTPFGQQIFETNILGNRLVEAKEINNQLKT